MKISFMLLFILIETYLSVVPNWDYTTSVTNLLSSGSITYTIDERTYWYEADDKLEKTITKDTNGVITLKNTLTLKKDNEHGSGQLFYGEVPFESIESFYSYVDGETSKAIVCPRGSYNPFEVISGSSLQEMTQYSTEWIKNSKFDLKCYYHRHEPFMVFYLMNKESYVLRLKNSVLSLETKFKFGDDIEEIYDFKLQNRERRTGKGDSWINNPYPFMALVKRNNSLELIGAQFDFNANQQNQTKSRILLPIKTYTQAYFNNFHFNNSFYYFTYNDINDFTSGYSITKIEDEDHAIYQDDIDDIVFYNNLESPFEFTDEVEIKEMNIMYNNNFVYYTILNKVTQVTYHGILDILTNKIVWNTDKEITLFLPYIRIRVTTDNKGQYEYADSMLIISKDSASLICPIKYNGACVTKCPDNYKLVIDTDGTKCVENTATEACNDPKRTLIPDDICIPKEQCNTTIYKMNNTHC